MQCPECQSEHIRKNGHRRGKQNHICVDCDRQFVEAPQTQRGYSDEVRELCLKMSVNSTGFRAIKRITGVHHTTVIHWLKQVGELLPDRNARAFHPTVNSLSHILGGAPPS
jgi:transposase-like protein